MPRFEPFTGLRYATDVAGSIDDVSCPPYDVLTAERCAELTARSPYNMVRLEVPAGMVPGSPDAAAGVARATLDGWRAAGVLRRDPQPAFYGYRTTAPPGHHRARQTVGVVGALALEPPGDGILPHEETTHGSRAGHSRLLGALRVNVSPIWALSPVSGLADLAAAPPETGPGDPGSAGSDTRTVHDPVAHRPDTHRPDTHRVIARALDEDGVLHEVWPITDPERIRMISTVVGSAPLVLADGHHRFETALAYAQARLATGHADDTGAGSIMAYVVELSEEQLQVQAIHRLLVGLRDPEWLLATLAPHFELEATAPPDPSIPDRLQAAGAPAVVTRDGTWLAHPRVPATGPADDLDASRVDAVLTELAAVPGTSVVYQSDWAAVATSLATGAADAGLLLRPPTLRQILELSRDGRRMPPKTSFFWPKPRTGLVLRELDA